MTRSLVGCSAAMCIDLAPDDFGARARQKTGGNNAIPPGQRAKPLPPARRKEGIPAGQCGRCGMLGSHPTPAACIEALRDRLARFE